MTPWVSTRDRYGSRNVQSSSIRGVLTTTKSSSREQERRTRRTVCFISLLSFWSCMLACDDLLAGKIASAEVPVLPSISSSPLHSSFVSGSKARIVIPSCEDQDGNGDFDEFETLEEESLAEISLYYRPTFSFW